MYSFIDQPVGSLNDGSHFLLWAMRGWTMSAGQNRCPTVTLASSFSRMGMFEVLDDFHGLMLGCHVHGRQPPSFGAIDDPRITESEALMLSLWSDAVTDRLERVRIVLALMIAEQQVGRVVARMVRIAAHMSTIGLAPYGLRHDAAAPVKSGRPA